MLCIILLNEIRKSYHTYFYTTNEILNYMSVLKDWQYFIYSEDSRIIYLITVDRWCIWYIQRTTEKIQISNDIPERDLTRVACPNFDILPWLRHSRFTRFIDGVGMLQK